MATEESLHEAARLRFRFQMNNRLRLESLAAISRVFRDFGEPIEDELLASMVFAVPEELVGEYSRFAEMAATKRPPKRRPPTGGKSSLKPPAGKGPKKRRPSGGPPPKGLRPPGGERRPKKLRPPGGERPKKLRPPGGTRKTYGGSRPSTSKRPKASTKRPPKPKAASRPPQKATAARRSAKK